MSSMRGLALPVLLALPTFGGCVIPETVGDALATSEGSGSGPGTTGAETTAQTSEGPGATSMNDDTSGGSGSTSQAGSESGAMLGPCDDPQVIPPPPVDCSEADGVIAGSVIIGEGGTDDPSVLEGVRRVDGAIRIISTDLTNLDFMACVEEVGADVTIFGNEQLVDVGGLWSLSELGTDFVFSSNDGIEVFDGLPNLVQILGSVVIRENASLQRLDGFHRFVGLEGMGTDPETGEVIGGNLTIQENPVLTSIDGMLGLMVVRGRFQLNNNPMLCQSSVIPVFECIVVPAEPDCGWSCFEPKC